jgi:hypothetical protein
MEAIRYIVDMLLWLLLLAFVLRLLFQLVTRWQMPSCA